MSRVFARGGTVGLLRTNRMPATAYAARPMPVTARRAALTGLAMGTADLVPGVSGGTIALVAGVYDDLIESIAAVDREAVGLLARGRFRDLADHVNLRFLAPLLAGIATAVLLLAGVLHDWLEEPDSRAMLFSFFMGLVLASIIAVGSHVEWGTSRWLAALGGGAIGIVVAFSTPARTPETALWALLGGALAISAMILPGISGSFILLLVGQYDRAIEAVAELDLATIGLFGLGAIAGLLVMVRLLRWALRSHRDLTLASLVGLMAGTLPRLWPWNECPDCADPGWYVPEFGVLAVGIGLAVAGAIVVSALEWVGRSAGETSE